MSSRDNTNTYGGASFGANTKASTPSASQIPCPIIYDHIKSCDVCQRCFKNTCESVKVKTLGIDKQTFILYGIFFLFLIILITLMSKR